MLPSDKILPGQKASVSLCMIVRNEEAHLEECLQSAVGLTQEIIVVDTGSTDGTKEIAARFGARIYDFAWTDDFSAARNESIRHATGAWIFWLDADDRLDETNRESLLHLFQNLPTEKIAYLMRYSCLLDPLTQKYMSVEQVRLFPNHPDIRWRHRVHEQILPAVQIAGGRDQKTGIAIRHVGYQDGLVRHRKHERNLQLLLLENDETPDHPFTLFNLGWTLFSMGRMDEARPMLERALQVGSPKDYQAPKLYLLLAQLNHNQGRMPEALETCQRGRRLFPADPELLFNEGLFYYERGDFRRAASRLEDLLEIKPSTWFTFGVNDGLSGYLTRHNLAIVYRDQGRVAEAEKQWRLALAEMPFYTVALMGLGELFVVQERWGDLDEICMQLDKSPGGATHSAVLRARAQMGRRQYSEAQEILEAIICEQPSVLWPRIILSRCLIQEGRDLEAAQEVLKAILERHPSNKEAKRSLAKLAAARINSEPAALLVP